MQRTGVDKKTREEDEQTSVKREKDSVWEDLFFFPLYPVFSWMTKHRPKEISLGFSLLQVHWNTLQKKRVESHALYIYAVKVVIHVSIIYLKKETPQSEKSTSVIGSRSMQHVTFMTWKQVTKQEGGC